MNEALMKAINNIKVSLIESKVLNDFVENINIQMNSIVKSLKPLMEQIKENAKIMAEHSISLGFYPSNSFSLYESQFIALDNRETEIEYITTKIRGLLTKDYIHEISSFFDKQKILEIFNDYLNKDYESAILKLIVEINVIFNDRLVGISGEQIPDIKRICNNIVTGVELPDEKTRKSKKDVDWNSIEEIHNNEGFEKYAYYIFAPYYYTKKNNNPLFKNCYDDKKTSEKIKSEYKKIPYNRNAIIHGYVEDYGTEENCLRWFSVLINTYEMFKLLEELSTSE